MWCTRWYLPLLLLPLPTAPPYFLILFLISLTMHARPCFYCVVLLVTLFVSSCYWQPFPLHTQLSTPWSADVTTFGEALNTTLPESFSGALPAVINVVDRCWCEFSSGPSLFEPFNISAWEKHSVEKVVEDLVSQEQNRTQGDETSLSQDSNTLSTSSSPLPAGATEAPGTIETQKEKRWSWFWFFKPGRGHQPEDSSSPPPMKADAPHPWQYDLSRFGYDLMVDFRWSVHQD